MSKSPQPMRMQFPSHLASTIISGDYQIIVTGAGGWLGQATIEMIEGVFGENLSSRVVAIASTPRELTLRTGRKLQIVDFNQGKYLAERPSLMAHFAFLTREKTGQISQSDYVKQNIQITSNAIQLANSMNVAGVFVVSSGAVYENDRTICKNIEHNPYGFLKAEEEKAFMRLSEMRKIPVSICRLFNLSGPFIHKEFALNSIILSVLARHDIVIKAQNMVVRDFNHVQDIVSLGFSMILDKLNIAKRPFDSGIGEPIEIGSLAKITKDILGQGHLKIIRNKIESNPNIYIGNTYVIKSLYRKYQITPKMLDQQILDTASYLMSLNSEYECNQSVTR